MDELCINTYDNLIVNQVHGGFIQDERGINIPCAFFVLAEITREEYIQFVAEKGLTNYIKRDARDKGLRFFRVKVMD